MFFCTQPFDRIEIYENGDVYNCCPSFVKYYSIGNIYKNSFDEIWNGDRIKILRKKILNGDFSMCDDSCNRKMCDIVENINYTDNVDKYPLSISISSDNICNIKCEFCRDEQFYTNYDKNNLENEIENIWLPIFKDAKILRFGCSGEPFASCKEMMIIKKAAEKYPNLKFHFHTNGILGDEQKLKELNVFTKIDTITLSLHSACEQTYNKIISGGNWNKVTANLKLYSKMRKDNLINNFRMVFVVYDKNFQDMEKFVQLAKEHNATADFWALRYVDSTKIGKNFNQHSIINKEHKNYKDLAKMLKNKIFSGENVNLFPELKQIQSDNNL